MIFVLFLAYELIMSLRKANQIWPFFGFDQSLSFPTADQGNDDFGNEITIFQKRVFTTARIIASLNDIIVINESAKRRREADAAAALIERKCFFFMF